MPVDVPPVATQWRVTGAVPPMFELFPQLPIDELLPDHDALPAPVVSRKSTYVSVTVPLAVNVLAVPLTLEKIYNRPIAEPPVIVRAVVIVWFPLTDKLELPLSPVIVRLANVFEPESVAF